jgi:hypothetical protein
MSRRFAVGLVVFAALIYVAVSARFWLGIENQNVASPDNKYWASTYSRSPFLLPFWRTSFVLIPSYGDLNSHEVYRTAGVFQTVNIRWIDNNQLEIVCHRCSAHQIEQSQVDTVHVSLKAE